MRLKILLHHESTNISYSYRVLYFQTPFHYFFSFHSLKTTIGEGGKLNLSWLQR